LYSKYLTKKVLEEFGDFRIGGQVIRTEKYVDDLVLLRKKRCYRACLIDELYGMFDKQIEIEMEILVDKLW